MKKIVFVADGTGAVLNGIALAQACRNSYEFIFVVKSHFVPLITKFGFSSHVIRGNIAIENWESFVKSKIDVLHLSPIEQIKSYIAPLFKAIVEDVVQNNCKIQKILHQICPDLICLDDVIMTPAIKQAGCPWIRIVSCNETEIVDEALPPRFSGYTTNQREEWSNFYNQFVKYLQPIHENYNEFLTSCGIDAYPFGQFLETSPTMNFLIYPEMIAYKRNNLLPSSCFCYLNGCIRKDATYNIPRFTRNDTEPLIYISYGSVCSCNVDFIKKQVAILEHLPYRIIINVGKYANQYGKLAENILLEDFPSQPSIISQADLVIHHGGNNTFNETLYFGKPSIIIPMALDGHDNAARLEELSLGVRLSLNDVGEKLHHTIASVVNDSEMARRLRVLSKNMQKTPGVHQAYNVIKEII